jgi:hypothetical protein
VTEKEKRRNLPYNTPVDGLVIRYLPVNLAYIVGFAGTGDILGGPFNTRTEAVAFADDLRRKDG